MQNFWNHLDQRIAPFNLLKHPFYQAWSAGELTREDLHEYAAEYWHHVSAFPTYLSALHAQLPDGELRRSVLRNLLDEEGIDAPDGRAHSGLWMDFARGMGADPAEVTARQLQPETQALIANFREQMKSRPAAALAALYAYESRVPEIARTKAEGLRRHYSVNPAGDASGAVAVGAATDAATARYFTLHQTADVHHAQVWRDLMDAELAANPNSAEAALNAAETAAHALWTALDGIERQRVARKAMVVSQ